MKQYVILLVCLLLSVMVIGQNETIPPKFKNTKDAASILKADNSALVNNYVKENFVCPRTTADCCKEGTEIVEFTVNKTGDLSDFKVINSICPDLDKEIIRVLKTTNGMWIPGMEKDEPIAMKSKVTFMLGNYSENNIRKTFILEATRNFKAGNKNFLVKNNPEKAIHFYNKAINYLPTDKVLLSMRALCHYALGDQESYNRDLNRIVTLGETNSLEIEGDITKLEGYSEMKEILAKHQ